MKRVKIFLIALVVSMVGYSATEKKAVHKVLDDLHRFAGEANGEKYFALFANDAVFIGTDITETWTIKEFKDYARPYFSKGKGWTYQPQKRNVYLSENQEVAWFDEVLQSQSFGPTRGTGVLIKAKDGWKIAQYHLTIPIPNAMAKKVAEEIARQGK